MVRNPVGVMQGRLLPKYQGQYQAHPMGYWADEFSLAQQFGLDCIEFILDHPSAKHNPLLNGCVGQIQDVVKKTGVNVKTICADYFMDMPLHSTNVSEARESMNVLRCLLASSIKLGVSDIVLPCVDQSSLNHDDKLARFTGAIDLIADELESKKINLSLETDLSPIAFDDLLNRIGSPRIKVNYDIGNSASLGYDLVEELDAYGERITDIHIKDRDRNGGPVVLGKGNADFERFFSKLDSFNYQGPFIMQAYRDDEGVAIFKQQLEWVTRFFQ